jgi:hypothetical protein
LQMSQIPPRRGSIPTRYLQVRNEE